MCPKLVSEGSHKAPLTPRWFESSHPDKNFCKKFVFLAQFLYINKASSLTSRTGLTSRVKICGGGGMVRRASLRGWWEIIPWRFDSSSPHVITMKSGK